MAAPPGVTDRDVARWVRQQVDANGGSLKLRVRELRDAFARSRLTDRARRDIERALAGAGVYADPQLEQLELEDVVRLYVSRVARPVPDGAYVPPPGSGTFQGEARAGWERYRRLPTWVQWAVPIVALFLLIGMLSGEEPSEPAEPAAQEVVASPSSPIDSNEVEDAREEEEAREQREARQRRRAREARAERRERRERRELRLLRREREEQESMLLEAPPEEAPAEENCHSSYSGCLDPNASDYDCEGGSGDGPEYASGPITVTGSDPYELDADGDGTACD